MTKCEQNRKVSNQVEFMLFESWNKSLWHGKKAFGGLAKSLTNQEAEQTSCSQESATSSQTEPIKN